MSTHAKKEYEDRLLAVWEEVHKKGQLTLWLLLALKEKNSHMTLLKESIGALTRGSVVADDQSMYRALRRLHSVCCKRLSAFFCALVKIIYLCSVR